MPFLFFLKTFMSFKFIFIMKLIKNWKDLWPDLCFLFCLCWVIEYIYECSTSHTQGCWQGVKGFNKHYNSRTFSLNFDLPLNAK